jgi:hypothetical protein
MMSKHHSSSRQSLVKWVSITLLNTDQPRQRRCEW